MSHPFHFNATTAFNHETLMTQIRYCMDVLPDSRTGANTTYEMSDAALSAFSVFFTQTANPAIA